MTYVDRTKKLNNDEICFFAMTMVDRFFREQDKIIFIDFDTTNKEHLFLLHIAMGLKGMTGQDLEIGTSFWKFRKLHRKFRALKRYKYTINDDEHFEYRSISPKVCLEYILKNLNSLGSIEYTMDDLVKIYEEFYEE